MSQLKEQPKSARETPTAQRNKPSAKTATRISRGGIDDISPEDIVYGEYSSSKERSDAWIDLVYLDDELLRTYSGSIQPNHPIVEELRILLRDEKEFYVIPVKEVPLGFAFKRTDVSSIKVDSVMNGNEKHVPSCVWTMTFETGKRRVVEEQYQAYFAYADTSRPMSMTNATILEKVFADSTRSKRQ